MVFGLIAIKIIAKILIKFVFTNEQDTKLSDWNISCIEEVEIEYGKLLRVIVY